MCLFFYGLCMLILFFTYMGHEVNTIFVSSSCFTYYLRVDWDISMVSYFLLICSDLTLFVIAR